MPNKLLIIVACFMLMMTTNSYAKSPTKISLEQASETIRKQSKGKVLSARTIRNITGTKTHKIKILTPDGRVKMHTIQERKSPDNNYYPNNNQNDVNSFNTSKYGNNNQRVSNSTSNTTKKK